MAIATSLCFVAVNQACVAAFAFRGRFLSIVLLSLQITSMGATFPNKQLFITCLLTGSGSDQCVFKPSFKNADISVKSNLLTLQIKDQKAQISMMFSFFKDGKELKSIVLSSQKDAGADEGKAKIFSSFETIFYPLN